MRYEEHDNLSPHTSQQTAHVLFSNPKNDRLRFLLRPDQIDQVATGTLTQLNVETRALFAEWN